MGENLSLMDSRLVELRAMIECLQSEWTCFGIRHSDSKVRIFGELTLRRRFGIQANRNQRAKVCFEIKTKRIKFVKCLRS